MEVYIRRILLLIWIACIQVVRACNRVSSSIRCYHCDSVASPDTCGIFNFNSSIHKYDTVSASWSEKSLATRSCAVGVCSSGSTSYYCRKMTDGYHDDGYVDDIRYCNEDLCNQYIYNQGHTLNGVGSGVLFASFIFTFFGK